MARNKFDVDERLEAPFNLSHLKRSMVYIRRHRFKMLLALLLSAMASASGLFGPKIMQWTLDDAVPNRDVSLLFWLALLFAASVVVGILFTTIRSRIMAHVSQQIVYDIREDLFSHLQKLPFSYYDSRPAGKILVRVINYVNSVADMLSNGIINTILEFVNLIFILIFMFKTNVTMSLMVVAGLPVFIAVILLLKPRQRRAWRHLSNKSSNYTAYLAESIDGVRVSQLFSRQEENIGTLQRLVESVRSAWMKAVTISFTVGISAELLSQIVFTLMYIAGVYWLGGAIVSFGVVVAMGQYVSRFWQPIINLSNIYNMFINNIAYLERIFETMDEPVTVDDAADAYELPEIHGRVSFQNVSFSYEPGIPILSDISFEVEAGESVALVGPTGAGKTTVVNLISRFYNISDGAIIIDRSHDISQVTLRSLRRQMGIMLQDTFIFSGTILDNIRYGRLDATEDEVVAAAKAVRAHDFIVEMEKGYYTEVNERGSSLSQGQRQLISFARTLIANPKILILDEATSSIDTKTERLLQEGIKVLTAGRTSFIIAHRLSTIKGCDKIMYVGDRKILETGSHDQLINLKGLYYRLYTAQSKEMGALEPIIS
ncbi:MAG: ABC transporter ATP-binding protein [Oscillospiraceae bacterium]|nr:ABC transporter ATP-binding protein [Oscillospiraceae bacterium]